jgi:uncharacterized membrane protein (DUF485 family)
MAHLHQDPPPTDATPKAEIARNARYGLVLYAVYAVLYAAFMLLTAFAPQVMETVVGYGINLAVLYGLGLIAAAFVLALVYAWLCRAAAGPGAGT